MKLSIVPREMNVAGQLGGLLGCACPSFHEVRSILVTLAFLVSDLGFAFGLSFALGLVCDFALGKRKPVRIRSKSKLLLIGERMRNCTADVPTACSTVEVRVSDVHANCRQPSGSS